MRSSGDAGGISVEFPAYPYAALAGERLCLFAFDAANADVRHELTAARVATLIPRSHVILRTEYLGARRKKNLRWHLQTASYSSISGLALRKFGYFPASLPIIDEI